MLVLPCALQPSDLACHIIPWEREEEERAGESLSNVMIIRKSVPAAKLIPANSLPAVWAGLMPRSCGVDANLVHLKTKLSQRAVQ